MRKEFLEANPTDGSAGPAAATPTPKKRAATAADTAADTEGTPTKKRRGRPAKKVAPKIEEADDKGDDAEEEK